MPPCPRNARPRKEGMEQPDYPSCSQRPHDRNVLAWKKSASRRVRGGWVRMMRAVKDSLATPLIERPRLGKWHISVCQRIEWVRMVRAVWRHSDHLLESVKGDSDPRERSGLAKTLGAHKTLPPHGTRPTHISRACTDVSSLIRDDVHLGGVHNPAAPYSARRGPRARAQT